MKLHGKLCPKMVSEVVCIFCLRPLEPLERCDGGRQLKKVPNLHVCLICGPLVPRVYIDADRVEENGE